LHRRAFVLQPLLEIAPHVEAPGLGPLAPWLAATCGQAIERIESSQPTP
jgi:2-amino-4-hydroxy-6-hydroxymethyldihydropteridine diphosphokinase